MSVFWIVMHGVRLEPSCCHLHRVQPSCVSFAVLPLTEAVQKLVLGRIVELDDGHLEETEKDNDDKVDNIVPVFGISLDPSSLVVSVHVGIVEGRYQAVYGQADKGVFGHQLADAMSIKWRFFVHPEKLVLGHPVEEEKGEEGQGVNQGHAAEVEHAEEKDSEGFSIQEFDVEDLPFEFFLHFLLGWLTGSTTLIAFLRARVAEEVEEDDNIV